MSKQKWTTANGEELFIEDMTDRHLCNAIAYLKRHIETYPGEQFYWNDDSYAEHMVEQDNSHNRELLDEINKSLTLLEGEVKRRESHSSNQL